MGAVVLCLLASALADNREKVSRQPSSFDDTASIEENYPEFDPTVITSKPVALGEVVGVPMWFWPPYRSFYKKPSSEQPGAPVENVLRELIDQDVAEEEKKQKDVLERIAAVTNPDTITVDPEAIVNDMMDGTNNDTPEQDHEKPDEPSWEPIVNPKLEKNPSLLVKDVEEQIQQHDVEMNRQLSNLFPNPVAAQEGSVPFIGLTENVQFTSIPFYGPFANEAVLSINFLDRKYSLLQGMEPREAVNLIQYGSDPDLWADATIDPIHCSEHSYHTPALSAPGGDLGEFTLAMHVYQEMLAMQINEAGRVTDTSTGSEINLAPSDVYRVLVDWLSQTRKKAFHICVGAQFLNGLCSRTHYCPLSAETLMAPPDDMVMDMIDQLGYSNTIPSRHLFAMFNYPTVYETKPILVAAVTRAVFALLWNVPLDVKADTQKVAIAREKLQLVVSREQTAQSAVINIHTHPKCPTSLYPKMSTVARNYRVSRSAFVLYPEALNVHRVQMALYLSKRSADIGGMESPVARQAPAGFANLPPVPVQSTPVFLELSASSLPDDDEEEQNFNQSEDFSMQRADEINNEINNAPAAEFQLPALEEAEGDDDLLEQKKSRVFQPTKIGAAQRMTRGSGSTAPFTLQDRMVDRGKLAGLRMRLLGTKHTKVAVDNYLGDLPVYNVVFSPTSSMDPCSFKPPFNGPFLDEGPWIEQSSAFISKFSIETPKQPNYTLIPDHHIRATETESVLASLKPGMVIGKVAAVVDRIFQTFSFPSQAENPQTELPVRKFEWVRARFASLGPMDGRVKEPVLAAPGADMGQWIIVLAAFEKASKRHLTQHEADQLFRGLLEASERKAFSLWTDAQSIDHLCHVTHACPVFDPKYDSHMTAEERLQQTLDALRNPPADLLSRLRDECGKWEANGDQFIRWVLGDHARSSGIRAEIASIAIRSFFGVLWNFMPEQSSQPLSPITHAQLKSKLDWVIMSGPVGEEGALVSVTGGSKCSPGVQPAMAESIDEQKFLLHHPVASELLREHFLEFVLSYHPPLQPSHAALRVMVNDLAEDVTSAHTDVLLKSKSRYWLEVSGGECKSANI
eukprot:c8071_g1_i1.p1 GENE.c8071_g1_i1~~c8071_g1_i1.p1  ORF type:complete len:1080 (+),score=267.73 c8071_g1_i1:30-3269(+)